MEEKEVVESETKAEVSVQEQKRIQKERETGAVHLAIAATLTPHATTCTAWSSRLNSSRLKCSQECVLAGK